MARPRLGEQKKTHRVGVFFTEAEYTEICEKANAAGLEPAEFLRRVGLEREVKGQTFVPEINKKAAQDINGGLNLLNQAMRMIYTGRAENLPEGLLEVLREEMKWTRDALLGR